MNLDPLRDELDAIAERDGRFGSAAPWVLFGSTVLLLWGLRDEVGDVDVFADEALWARLARSDSWEIKVGRLEDPSYLERHVDGIPVHVFYAWTRRQPEVDAAQCCRAAQDVHGWPCTPLGLIRMHKAMAIERWPNDPRVEKDLADIKAIDELQERRRAA